MTFSNKPVFNESEDFAPVAPSSCSESCNPCGEFSPRDCDTPPTSPESGDIDEDVNTFSDIDDIDIDQYIVDYEEDIGNKTADILACEAICHFSQTKKLNRICKKGLNLFKKSVDRSVYRSLSNKEKINKGRKGNQTPRRKSAMAKKPQVKPSVKDDTSISEDSASEVNINTASELEFDEEDLIYSLGDIATQIVASHILFQESQL